MACVLLDPFVFQDWLGVVVAVCFCFCFGGRGQMCGTSGLATGCTEAVLPLGGFLGWSPTALKAELFPELLKLPLAWVTLLQWRRFELASEFESGN